jgi:serine/threonine protein kinase
MNPLARELDEAERPTTGRRPDGRPVAPAAMKFTYPSGARPLEGYTIKRGVGRGGFGEVYFATSDAGKEVALKLIRRNLEVELRGVTQCLNLKHPNLIALYDIRTDEMGDQWVIMEYVSGESLEDVIERHPNGMPLPEVLWWIRGICAGVAYLHDHGIVHRDLKPGNIFSDEGTVKIGDYGLAKFISCSRRSGQTESVGTVHYMAPEIANGRYGREIDTYALGIILFEMLTGRVPFEGESVGEVLMKHLTAEPDLSAIDEPYRDIVQRALAKDPNVRLKSVNEILSLLPDVAGAYSPRPAAAPQSSDVRTSASTPGSIRDFDAVARDGLHNAAPMIRTADERAVSAAPGNAAHVEEPIWKAIREGFAAFRARWHGENVPPLSGLQKALIIFAAVMCCIWFFDLMIRFAVPVAICYGVYYLVWASAIRPNPSRSAADGRTVAAANSAAHAPVDQQTIAWQPAAGGVAAPAKTTKTTRAVRRRRPNWREAAQRELAAKPWREKFSELLGSMLVAAIVATVAAGIGPMLLGGQPDSERAAMYLWLMVVGTLGSWAILIPTKFVEGKLEDQVPMRITLLGLGALVGMAAWALADALLLKPVSFGEPIDAQHGLISQKWLGLPTTYVGDSPSLLVYTTYFAFLFLLPRWWRHAEYTRDNRLSVWWLIVSIFWGWVIHLFWWFPQPTGVMVAGILAAATQLASPWMPPSRRRALSAIADQTV